MTNIFLLRFHEKLRTTGSIIEYFGENQIFFENSCFFTCILKNMWYNVLVSDFNGTICGYGGIGRRASFRCWWGQPRGGSSPLIRTIPRVLIGFEMFYKHSRFFIAFNQYADSFHSSMSILIIFLLFLFAVFRMSCVTSIFRERLHKLGVKIVFTD